MSILKKIKNFLFTKKSKSQPVIQTQVMQPAAEPIDDLFEDLPVVGVSVEDTWNPYNENNREDPVSTVVVPSSILGGAINRIKSSFILRWYCEKKKIAETGITTRQRIKRATPLRLARQLTDTPKPNEHSLSRIQALGHR